MTAEIVSVGTELLLGATIDTNSAELGKLLALCGVDHLRRQTVGDNLERMVEALTLAASRSDIVFTIGGLGPTEDDLTRQAISSVSGCDLVYSAEIERRIRDLMNRRGREYLESQRNQCFHPKGADILQNSEGTAPGFWLEFDGTVFVALPGPPREFNPMLKEQVLPKLERLGLEPIRIRVLKVTGLGESEVESAISPMLKSDSPTVATYAKTGEVHVRLAVRASEASSAVIADAENEIRNILGSSVYGADDETLESVVLEILRDSGGTLSTAESCTGGRIASRITSVAGSGDAYLGGVVSYAESAKVGVLGVPSDLIARFGVVSEECAAAMAHGAREKFGSDYALSVTGYAGPSGGTEVNPVGTVYIGLGTPSRVDVRRFWFGGSRSSVQDRTSQSALEMMYFELVASGN